jgi:hypothetical protein
MSKEGYIYGQVNFTDECGLVPRRKNLSPQGDWLETSPEALSRALADLVSTLLCDPCTLSMSFLEW